MNRMSIFDLQKQPLHVVQPYMKCQALFQMLYMRLFISDAQRHLTHNAHTPSRGQVRTRKTYKTTHSWTYTCLQTLVQKKASLAFKTPGWG